MLKRYLTASLETAVDFGFIKSVVGDAYFVSHSYSVGKCHTYWTLDASYKSNEKETNSVLRQPWVWPEKNPIRDA